MTSRAERRRALGAALLLGVACLTRAPALAAQDEGNPWRVSDFPYLMGDPTNGLLVIGHIQYAKEADYDARVPYDGYIGLEAAWGTRSSRYLTLKYRAPTQYKGWRLAADAGAVREGHFGYFGQGAGGQGAGVDPDDASADRVHRTRYFGRGEVTRALRPHLAVSGAAGITYFRYQGIAAGDQFHADFGDAALSGTDATGRVSLIFDTRRNELVPRSGLLLEAGLYAGSGKYETRTGGTPSFTGSGYTGIYAHLRGWVAPLQSTVLSGRVAVRSLSKNAPLDARYVLPGWEREITVLGGPESQRGLIRGRYVGRGVLISSVDVRHTLIDVGDYGSINVLAFLDAGRVDDGAAKLSLSHLKVGGGGGLGIKVIRSALLSINFATGPDGFTFSMANGWAF
jgi:hypothetical protein